MGLKDAFLNKGWAGKTFTREKTVERINPIIRRHAELNHAYNYAINHVSQRETASELEALQKTARADVGKLSETVLSAGAASYNGIELKAEDFALAEDEGEMIAELKEQEEQFQELVSDELKENHQIRTRAILSVVQANSRTRLDYLRGLAKNQRQSE